MERYAELLSEAERVSASVALGLDSDLAAA